MQKVILLVSIMFCAVGFPAAVQVTASGGSPIPTSYSASDTQSRAQECTGNIVEIMNETSSKLAVGFGTATSTPSDYKFVPAGPSSWTVITPKGGLGSGTYVYLRSAGSSITSGSYTVSCTSEEQQ